MSTTTDRDTRRTIRWLIERQGSPDVTGMLLFGSRARGEATEESDWDVAVFVRPDADPRAVTHRLLAAITDVWGDARTLVHPLVLRPQDLASNPSLALNLHDDAVPL